MVGFPALGLLILYVRNIVTMISSFGSTGVWREKFWRVFCLDFMISTYFTTSRLIPMLFSMLCSSNLLLLLLSLIVPCSLGSECMLLLREYGNSQTIRTWQDFFYMTCYVCRPGIKILTGLGLCRESIMIVGKSWLQMIVTSVGRWKFCW